MTAWLAEIESCVQVELPDKPSRILIIGPCEGSLETSLCALLANERESQKSENVQWLTLAQPDLEALKSIGGFDVIIIDDAHRFGNRLTEFLSQASTLANEQTKLLLSIPNLGNHQLLNVLLRGDWPEESVVSAAELEPRMLSRASAFKLLLDAGWLPKLIGSPGEPLPSTDSIGIFLQAARESGVAQGSASLVLRARQFLISARKSPQVTTSEVDPQTTVSVIVPVTNESQFRLNTCLSPGYKEIGAEIIPVRGASSAADAFHQGASVSRGTWRLFVHQDVYLPAGSGWLLIEELNKLTREKVYDQPIGFVGTINAPSEGGGLHTITSGCVVDRTVGFLSPPTVEALALDELGILLHSSSSLCIDASLGWHCWATDLCLQAEEQTGYPCARTMNVPVFHNSVNSQLGIAYYESAYSLLQKYPMRSMIVSSCAHITLPDVNNQLRILRKARSRSIRRTAFLKFLRQAYAKLRFLASRLSHR